jgi:hypothetical protein
VKTNYKSADFGLKIQHGAITLEEGINDYPKLNIIEYTDSPVTRPVRSLISIGGLTFYVDGVTINKNLIEYQGKTNEVTYSCTHVSKLIYEYPINMKDFVDSHKGSAVKKTQTSLFFNIGSLVSFATGRAGLPGNVAPPGFIFETSKVPSPEETATIKQFVDDKIEILGLVYSFSGSTLTFRGLGGGGTNGKVVSNITYGYNTIPCYKNTILEWSKKQEYDNSLNQKKYQEIKDQEYVIYEGAYQPHLPPPEAQNADIFPRDLSIMIDNSGTVKEFKITKYKWGEPAYELSGVFGFAHTALELVEDPEKPNSQTDVVLALMKDNIQESDNAYQDVLNALKADKLGYPDEANFSRPMVWRLLSIKSTTYVYESFTPNISPMLKKEDGTLEPVIIPPEYQKYLNTNLQYLKREISTGWEIKRFAQEDPSNWANGSIAAWLALKTLIQTKDLLLGTDFLTRQQYFWTLYYAKVNLEQYLYRKIPLWEQVDYALEPYSKYYKDEDEIDWEVQYIPKSQLDNKSGEGDDTPVPVLFPDPNWMPNLMIIARSRFKSSVGISGNPNYNINARNYFGSNPLTVLTGSDEYELTKYSVLPSKNTRDTIGLSYTAYADINEIIAAVETGQSAPGTYYKSHDYMTIGDYGIKSIPVQKVDTSKVAASYPAKRIERDDQYTSLISLRVAQDHSYKSHLTTTTFTLADGRPPKATLRKPVYEEVKNGNENNPLSNSITYVTSNIANGAEIMGSVSVSAAQNIDEALRGAANKLRLDVLMSGSTASAELSFTSFSGRSIINTGCNLPGTPGAWVVKRATQVVQYSNGIPFPQNIQVECGALVGVGISSRTVQIADENNNQESVKVLINPILGQTYGTPLNQIPANFSRWLDSNS